MPVDYAAVDPLAFLTLAHTLAAMPDAEARRSAADRAYYAVFLFSRNELERKHYATFTYSTDDHREVTIQLKRLFRSLGSQEEMLRYARNVVTYDTWDLYVYTGWPTKPLGWILKTAEEIIEAVKRLPVNTNSSH